MRIGLRRLDGGLRTVVIRGEEALTLAEGAPTPDDVVRDPTGGGSSGRRLDGELDRGLDIVANAVAEALAEHGTG